MLLISPAMLRVFVRVLVCACACVCVCFCVRVLGCAHVPCVFNISMHTEPTNNHQKITNRK
jgi:hypothetical protein